MDPDIVLLPVKFDIDIMVIVALAHNHSLTLPSDVIAPYLHPHARCGWNFVELPDILVSH